ncbi:MAG: hypothetical protein HY521_07845 [Proteobacteria bacterium]|nr:hypothetical protein [Pseudomonadota bacterium]
MRARTDTLFAAFAVTLFVSTIGAVVFWTAAFMSLSLGGHALGVTGALSEAWSLSHLALVTRLSAAFTVPLTAALAVWTFRRAYAVERELAAAAPARAGAPDSASAQAPAPGVPPPAPGRAGGRPSRRRAA